MKKMLFIAVLAALLILTVVPAFATGPVCPGGFTLICGEGKEPEDRNGDILICRKVVGNNRVVLVDNNIPLSEPVVVIVDNNVPHE